MKIIGSKARKVGRPLKDGGCNWPNGNFVEFFDSTVVTVGECAKASRERGPARDGVWAATLGD